MAERKPLRAVAPGEKAPQPMTVAEAAALGSDRDELVAMRLRVAKAIDAPDIRGADLAALTRRLSEIRKDIKAIDAREKQEGAQGGPTADEEWSAI